MKKIIMKTETYFKKFEVIGTSKDEAINNAAPMVLRVDATQAYKKWAENNVTSEENVREWMENYLAAKNFTAPNDAAYIVLQSAIKDVRQRPHQVEEFKYEARTHTPEKFYVLRTEDNEEIEALKTKKEALQRAKEAVADLREDVNIFTEWKTKEKNALCATVHYKPTKGTRPAKLLVFGYATV